MTHDKEKKQLIEADLSITHMLNLVNNMKLCIITAFHMFKKLIDLKI